MLSPEDLFKAKREYGTILVQEINTVEYTFRLLSPEDYRLIMHPGSIDSSDMEDIVCSICVLDPVPIDYEQLDFGASDLAELIVSESGLKSPDELLFNMKKAREEIATDSLNFIIANICSAFPTYTPDDLEKKPVPKLLKLLAMAESIQGKEIITPQLFRRMNRQKDRTMNQAPMDHPRSPTDINAKKFNMDPDKLSADQDHNMAVSTDALSDALAGKI
jgi:hypothetical protein